jgi:hypothetical protein
MLVTTETRATMFAANGAAVHDREATAWGKRLAAEDRKRSADLTRILKANRHSRERKTNVGDRIGEVEVVAHLPKSGGHSCVLVACSKGHRLPFRTDLLRDLGDRAKCRGCKAA